MDPVRARTRRCIPLKTTELIAELNPLLREWGNYYQRAHVRKLFHRLDDRIRRRSWSQRYRRWRCAGWKELPEARLYGKCGLVKLDSVNPVSCVSVELSLCEGCMPQNRTCSLSGGVASAQARHLRPDFL